MIAPGTLAALERVLDGCGWDQGGRVIRGRGPEGPVTGRTVWIARCAWWHDRPAGLTERRAREVVHKALRGCPLGERRRYLAFLVDTAEEAVKRGVFTDPTSGPAPADPAGAASDPVPF